MRDESTVGFSDHFTLDGSPVGWGRRPDEVYTPNGSPWNRYFLHEQPLFVVVPGSRRLPTFGDRTKAELALTPEPEGRVIASGLLNISTDRRRRVTLEGSYLRSRFRLMGYQPDQFARIEPIQEDVELGQSLLQWLSPGLVDGRIDFDSLRERERRGEQPRLPIIVSLARLPNRAEPFGGSRPEDWRFVASWMLASERPGWNANGSYVWERPQPRPSSRQAS